MKKHITFWASLILICFMISPLIAQKEASNSNSWSVPRTPHHSFIKNQGQFKQRKVPNMMGEVKYAYDGNNNQVLFTKSGLVIELTQKQKRKKSPAEKAQREAKKKIGFASAEEFRAFENVGHRLQIDEDDLFINFIGANPNVKLVMNEKDDHYHSYSFYDAIGQFHNINHIPSWKKLTYKNLYPNIDFVYEIHPVSGFKYTIIVHPGGNIADIQLEYSKNIELKSDGSIRTKTKLGDILDHPPLTFYAKDKNNIVASTYKVENNIISFHVANYDQHKTLVIDPWTQLPNFISTGWDCVWECERDGLGNVYVIGGTSPMQLIKYNAAGTPQWTYNTPYDTTAWLGTFAVDLAGNSYVSNGSVAKIFKVNTAGGLVWNNPNPGGLLALTEFWNITFNCDQTRLVIAGTDGGVFSGPQPYIFDIDMNTGNVLTAAKMHNGGLFNPQEVRSITPCNNGKYYFLSHDSIGYIHQSLTTCVQNGNVFHVDNGIGLGYKCEDWRYNNAGIMAIAHYNGFIYVHRGNQLQKRDFNTAAVLATVAIPGGIYNTGFGGNNVGCSGIDIDDCGNIFVGSVGAVYKFDQNLTQIGNYPTAAFNVYDVEVNSGGEIIVGGSTGTSGSGARTGYIQSIAAAACAPQAIVCCDATICQVEAVCETAAPFPIVAATPGGTYSSSCGLCINPITGIFDPALAGVGTHTVTYTLPCGSETISVVVNNCTAITVCEETNGDFTVSGGTGPYSWYQWVPGSSTPITNSTQCTACGYTWVFGSCRDGGLFGPVVTSCTTPSGWVLFNTGVSIPNPGFYPIQVRDNLGDTFNITGPGVLPPCTSCPTLTITPSAQSNVACFGQSTGSFSVSTTGGASPYDYVLKNAGLTVASFNDLAGSALFSLLAAANYTLVVTDDNGCTDSILILITQPNLLNINLSNPTASGCDSSLCVGAATSTVTGGTTNYTYLWSNGNSNPNPIDLCPGFNAVTVTDALGCTDSASVIITTPSHSTPPMISPVSGSYCPNTTVNLSASGGIAGTGSNINWYTGPNGTGTWLGTGPNVNIVTSTTATYYVRREGTCNNSADSSVVVNVKYYIYAPNAANSNTYCTDNAGWHHFFIGDEIIFSVQGDIATGAVANYPLVTIWDSTGYYQETQGPFTAPDCATGGDPGEERFEMERSWNVDLGGGAVNPPYNIRFYYQPAERSAIENAAINWMASYPACGYSYKYPNPLGFYWFKNEGANYDAPLYDSLHLAGIINSTNNAVNYTEISGITSFSGGSGAVILIPVILLPVDWLYFNGETDNKVNYLTWGTEQEDNTAYFNIERSNDGINFHNIGTVAAQGFSNQIQHYSFDDLHPFTGPNYYRLELIDSDGKGSYSNTILLHLNQSDLSYYFYPNPTDGFIYYQFEVEEEEILEIKVYDVLGKLLAIKEHRTTLGINNLPTDLSDYPAGTYMLRVLHKKMGYVHITKVIKNKK